MASAPVVGLLAVAACAAGIQIRVDASGRLGITAKLAPVSAILDCLAERTGMKVEYDSPRARAGQTVSVELEAQTLTEAVSRVLEGQGLNYALRLNPTRDRVERLIIAGSSSGAPPPLRPVSPPAAPPPPEPDQPAQGVELRGQQEPLPEPPETPPYRVGPPPMPFPVGPGQISPAPAQPLFPEARPLTLAVQHNLL